MSMEKKETETNRINQEITDLEERLNDLELQMVDAKEFTHISSDAFEALQAQIAELREMFESLLLIKSPDTEKSISPFAEYQ